MITSFTPVDVHHTTLTLHTAAGLISLPIAAAPITRCTLHSIAAVYSPLVPGVVAGCCWLLLVGVGWCWLVLLLCWKAGGSSRTALCPGQHSTEPHTATAGVASTATTLNNTQQHSTAASNSPTTAGATAALVLHPGLCVHPWLGRVLAIPSGAGRAGGWWQCPLHWRDHCRHLGSGATLQHAACSMGTCGDMCGWRVVSGHPGHGTPELVAGERQCWRQQGPAQWTMGWWWWVQLHSRQTLDTAAAHTPPYQGGKPSKRYNYRVSLRPSVTTARDSLSVSPHITHGSADSSNPVAGGW